MKGGPGAGGLEARGWRLEAWARGPPQAPGRASVSRTLPRHRQPDGERRTAAGLRFNGQRPTVSFDDSVRHAQAQTDAIALRLRREEGLEDSGFHLARH